MFKLAHISLLIFSILLSSCGHLFYQGHEKIYMTPDKFMLDYEVHTLKSRRNKLKAWLVKPKSIPLGTIIFFHGNAENRSTHFIQLGWLVKKGWNVFIADYSGYADSEGKSTREQIYHDSLNITEYGLKNFPGPFVMYGQSLGGNIAMAPAAAYQDQLDLLILDSTFGSYQEISFKKLYGSWLTFVLSPLAYVLVNDDYTGEKYLKDYTKPLMVIHSKDDQVVPFELGEKIFKNSNAKEKHFFKYEDYLHLQIYAKENNREEVFKKMMKMVKLNN